ncbi:MAG: glycosyltransferase family 2 protein [Pseudomonadota bacterium]|nr:glycosyltransferase family 2 protein [Alphaproteobacteria bacterium]MDZ4812954.1 glycosyltransferase family 2 protein [Pseudomonadota bacterium]
MNRLEQVLADTSTGKHSDLAIVVPAFNEVGAIADTIRQLREMIANHGLDASIVVVDDGSTDGTGDAASKSGSHTIRCPSNLGYGHALKIGIAASASDYVVIIDADGTYPVSAIPTMLEQARGHDMIVGNRGEAMTGVPLIRKPAKWILNNLANTLAKREIPDLNSGLRVMRRSSLQRFIQLLPDGFSFTTTITLCMICSGLSVVYHPIVYGKRVGHSKIRPTDFFRFMLLVVRIIMLFHPLRVFMPIGLGLFVVGIGKTIYDIYIGNLSESAIFALLAAVMIWSLGLIADMISRLHLRA